ncbi:MAG: glycoside-pentoside-hexuronide (GPH):cation symporter [Treponemataceae bacterium]|nr:glycoside-pentoside-hexuronide (GPH):cation symporter [Treponemataceae bacterium]
MAETNQTFISKASGLKAKDYIAYALGDVGGCLVFSLVTTILQVFYTDVFKLNPLFIMFMFVGARIWDGINDPIMGRICDTVKVSKWGRYRPWFLYGAMPLAASAILMFIKWPGLKESSTGIAVYATVTYILFGMCYTMVQIPYGSLASVVTLDDKERSKLSVWRSVGATIGSMPIMVVSAMCIKTLRDDAGNKIGTYVDYKVLVIGVIAMALASLIMYLFAFMGNKERVVSHPKKAEKGDTWKAIKRLATNKAMLSISIVSMLLLAGQMFTQSYYIYLIKQYFGRGGIWTTLPTVLTYLPMAILMCFTPKLVRKFGKREICAFGMVLAAVANFAMYFLKFMNPETAIYPFMVLCFVSGLGLNFLVLQVWALVSDCIDDIEVKTGSRDDGTAYSFFMFFRKFGQVIAAIAVNGSLLGMGYYETAKQSANGVFEFTSSQLGIMYALATLIPAVMFGLMALFLYIWYPLSKKRVAELQVEKEEHLKNALENNSIQLN